MEKWINWLLERQTSEKVDKSYSHWWVIHEREADNLLASGSLWTPPYIIQGDLWLTTESIEWRSPCIILGILILRTPNIQGPEIVCLQMASMHLTFMPIWSYPSQSRFIFTTFFMIWRCLFLGPEPLSKVGGTKYFIYSLTLIFGT